MHAYPYFTNDSRPSAGHKGSFGRRRDQRLPTPIITASRVGRGGAIEASRRVMRLDVIEQNRLYFPLD